MVSLTPPSCPRKLSDAQRSRGQWDQSDFSRTSYRPQQADREEICLGKLSQQLLDRFHRSL